MQWCHVDNTVKNDSNEHIIIHQGLLYEYN